MRIDAKSIKNILVVRNDRFGEFLLNIPALRTLKSTFVNARMIAVVNPYVKELAQCIPFIDEIIEWGNQGHSLAAKLRLANLLKKKNIGLTVILNPSREFHVITWLAGIPLRVGYDRKCGFLLTHKIPDKKYLGEKHEVEYNLDLVRLAGAETQDKGLSLRAEDDIIKNLINIKDGDSLVAIHPWTSDPVKQWPLENFRILVERIAKESNKKVVIVGGKEEGVKFAGYFDDLRADIINLTGKTTLMQLAALLKKCRLLISADSGPVHLASAVGTPVVAIFRNDLPGKTARRWGPWGKGHLVIEKPKLSQITVEEVLGKAKEILG